MIYGQIWVIDDKSNLVTYAVKLILILVWCRVVWYYDTMMNPGLKLSLASYDLLSPLCDQDMQHPTHALW